MVMFSPCRSSCHRKLALSPRLPSSPPPAVYHWIFHLRPASSPRPSPFFSRILHYVLFNVLKRLSIRTTMNPTLLKYTSFFFIRRCRFERIWEKIKFNEISNSCGVEKSSGNLNFGWNFLREENGVVENEGIQIELLFCRKVCVLDIFFFFLGKYGNLNLGDWDVLKKKSDIFEDKFIKL